jgi:glycogen synthase
VKIAFVSYEYPPDTADGGIATYVRQAATMLAERGHHAEVFCGSRERSSSSQEEKVWVHRTHCPVRNHFGAMVGPIFAARHQQIGFDVLEGPDFGADAAVASRLCPEVPLVVKLHTPQVLVRRFSEPPPSRLRQLTNRFGGMRWFRPTSEILTAEEVERLHVLQADVISSPSTALARLAEEIWDLDPLRVEHLPYPYCPSEELTKIPSETHTGVVTFLGRLEIRKGVLDLAAAIPLVLQEVPGARFRLIGDPQDSPIPGKNMRVHLQDLLGPHASAVEFPGKVHQAAVPRALAETDICVFPSIWENFPFVCLEAMSAARGIVASNAGGMAESLAGGDCGVLVPPRSPERLATVIIRLLRDPELRVRLGTAARERVRFEYHPSRIGPLQEQGYHLARENRRRGRRIPAGEHPPNAQGRGQPVQDTSVSGNGPPRSPGGAPL